MYRITELNNVVAKLMPLSARNRNRASHRQNTENRGRSNILGVECIDSQMINYDASISTDGIY
jgi:hypothetical protein